MITKTIEWVKTHKLLSVLVLVIIYLTTKQSTFLQVSKSKMYNTSTPESVSLMKAGDTSGRAYYPEAAPVTNVTTRKIITNSYLSLLVKNVTSSIELIKQKAVSLGGYVIDSNIEKPEGSETATVNLRVPTKDLDNMLSFLRGLSVRVVSENISGQDITDQYVDIEERISRLEKTKAKFEQILDSATKVEDMMNIQNQIMNLQDQIDAYKGQLKYIDGASDTTRISVYMSTDETGLPYTPKEPWKPATVFKSAVRALIATLQKLASLAIWAVVWSVLIVPAYLIFRRVKWYLTNKKHTK